MGPLRRNGNKKRNGKLRMGKTMRKRAGGRERGEAESDGFEEMNLLENRMRSTRSNTLHIRNERECRPEILRLFRYFSSTGDEILLPRILLSYS